MDKNEKMWTPKIDACDECRDCDYFLHDYWNCQGDIEPCLEFEPKPGSNKRLVAIEVTVDKEGKRNQRIYRYVRESKDTFRNHG